MLNEHRRHNRRGPDPAFVIDGEAVVLGVVANENLSPYLLRASFVF